MSNTGPSVQTHTLPLVVFSTQHKQAPMPQAIMFSSETRQAYPFCRDSAATAFIIGTGPQAATKSNCCAFHTEC